MLVTILALGSATGLRFHVNTRRRMKGQLCGSHAHQEGKLCACDAGFAPVKLGRHGTAIPCEHSSANEGTNHDDSSGVILFGTLATSRHCLCLASNIVKERGIEIKIPVSYKVWGERRKFDPQVAQQEGAWKASNGGLNDADRMILAQTYYESDSVFETGVGESTKICAFTKVPRYTGVDNAISWLGEVMKISPPHYRFHWADIGPVGAWSHPKDKSAIDKWPFSSSGALAAESEAFDFYFVDGRFRVASVAACMLHAAAHGRSPSEYKVGIHDFRKRAAWGYKDVLLIGTPIEGYLSPNKTTADLAILRRKEGVTDDDILKIWEKHKADAG